MNINIAYWVPDRYFPELDFLFEALKNYLSSKSFGVFSQIPYLQLHSPRIAGAHAGSALSHDL